MTAGKENNSLILFGFHSVTEALKNSKRQHRELFITKNSALILKNKNLSLPKSLKITTLTAAQMDALTSGAIHQGIALATSAYVHVKTAEELMEKAELVVALDQVTDPHNVGAILRSCAVFGVQGLIVTERHSPPLSATGTLAKVASGALEHVACVPVVNLARTLKAFWDNGYDIVGLAQEAREPLPQSKLSKKCVFVFGSEADGLRQLTRKSCSQLLVIPCAEHFPSLNVSNAVAVTLYAYRCQFPLS